MNINKCGGSGFDDFIRLDIGAGVPGIHDKT